MRRQPVENRHQDEQIEQQHNHPSRPAEGLAVQVGELLPGTPRLGQCYIGAFVGPPPGIRSSSINSLSRGHEPGRAGAGRTWPSAVGGLSCFPRFDVAATLGPYRSRGVEDSFDRGLVITGMSMTWRIGRSLAEIVTGRGPSWGGGGRWRGGRWPGGPDQESLCPPQGALQYQGSCWRLRSDLNTVRRSSSCDRKRSISRNRSAWSRGSHSEEVGAARASPLGEAHHQGGPGTPVGWRWRGGRVVGVLIAVDLPAQPLRIITEPGDTGFAQLVEGGAGAVVGLALLRFLSTRSSPVRHPGGPWRRPRAG